MNKKLQTCFWLAFTLFALASQMALTQWRQTAAVFGDEQWDDRFLPPGLSNGNSPLASHGIGALAAKGNEVYVGGAFTTAGGVPANNIAKWDGRRWSALGSGVRGGNTTRVLAIAFHGNDVYVGGDFSSAGGVPANNMAKWDGTQWSAVGNGTGGLVNDIAIGPNGEVYAAGNLPVLGHIAKWDGNTWSALGSGVSGSVFPGVSATIIVKWNGAAWSALGSGLDGTVRAIAVRGNEVFAGGNFKNAGGVAANGIAKWDGQSWSALGSGVAGNSAQVNAIAINGNEVYIGGSFITAGGATASNIAKWDGASWSVLGSGSNNGVDGSVNGIAVARNGEVYAGGIFNNAGGVSAKGIAKWNGASWSALGSGITGALQWVYAVAGNGDDIYVGGRFTAAGGINSNHIAKWNSVTSAWSAIGAGVGNPADVVFALAVNGNAVYVGGSFATAGGLTASNIAKWDGNQWSTFGSGIGGSNPVVLALVAAGGDFTTAGNKPSFKFARWSENTTGVAAEKIIPQPQAAGDHTLSWHAENMPSGVYWYRLQAGAFVETKKMILLR